MRQFESGDASAGKNINITARGYANTTSGSGQLYYETPVLNIMGREFSTFQEFQKSLAQLGHNSGNVLIRLAYKKTEKTLFEAMEEISAFFKDGEEEDGVEKKADEGTVQEKKDNQQQEDTAMTDAPTVPVAIPESSPQSRPVNSTTSEEQETPKDSERSTASSSPTPQDPYQPVNVFLAPTGPSQATTLPTPDETDFTPTIAQAQLHQAMLLQSSRNKRLPSDKELADKAAAEEARIAAIKSVLIKVRFPDNTSSEWKVGPNETGAFLYEAIRHVMADATQKFHLLLPDVREVIKDNSGPAHNLVKGYKLAGRVLVTLVWEDSVPASVRKQPFLKDNIAKQGQSIKVPDLSRVEGEPEAGPVKAEPKKEERRDKGDGVKKMPKWLKLGKK